MIARMLRIGTRSASRPCSTRTTEASGSTRGTSSSTSFGALFASVLSRCCDFFVTEQLVRVQLHDVAQMRCDDGAGVDDGVAERLRMLARRRLDPHRFHAEGRIARRDALERAEDAARIDRELAIRIDHAFADGHAAEIDAIGVRAEIEVVADVHRGNEEAEFLRQLAAHAADAREQVAALRLVHQRHEAVADFEAEQIDRLHVFPAQLARFGRAVRRRGGATSAALGARSAASRRLTSTCAP